MICAIRGSELGIAQGGTYGIKKISKRGFSSYMWLD